MRSRLTFPLVLCFLVGNVSGNVVFKADAPVDPDEERKYGFGSIWPGKDAFFKNSFNKKQRDKDVSLQAKQVPPKSEITKKDQVWEAALKVLKMFSLTYVNKEAGVIKTDESYVHEFDNTDSCRYKATVNIARDGEVAVHITSSDDSQTRISKHEELLKSRISTASSLPDDGNKDDAAKDNSQKDPAKQEKPGETTTPATQTTVKG